MSTPAYRIHPRNHDFAWQSGGADGLRRLTPGQLRQLDETGFFIASHTAFYLAYHGENNRELQIALARIYLKRMPDLAMTAPHCLGASRRPGRARIGFISRFLRKHSIGATARGLIEQLSRERFEVYALRIMPAGDDATTQAIRASADQTIDLHPELARARDQVAGADRLAGLRVGDQAGRGVLVLEVVDLGQRMGGTAELRVVDDVGHPLTVDPYRPRPTMRPAPRGCHHRVDL